MNQNAFTPTKGTLIVLLLASMLPLMGAAAVSPALPLISQAFPDVPESIISMIITLPSLAVALTGIFIGMAVDRFGKVPVFILSLLLFTIAGVSGYFLESLPMILLGRVLLGIGLGGIMTSVTTLITSYYSGKTRDKILGYEGAFIGLGMLVLETGGGTLALISWREPFLIYLIGLVILLGVVAAVREPAADDGERSASGQDSRKKINIPITLGISLTMFVYGFMLFLLPTKLPYLVSGLLSGSTMVTGMLLGTIGVFSAVSGAFYGKISLSLSRMTILSLAFLMIACGLALISTAASVSLIGIGAALTGFATGMVFPTLISWLSHVTPLASMGFVMGIITMIAYLGEFSNSWIIPQIQAAVGSQTGVFGVAAVICLITGILFGCLRAGEKRRG